MTRSVFPAWSILLRRIRRNTLLPRVENLGDFMPRDDLQTPPHDPLGEPLDVLLFDRTTESLEQENRWLKERLARMKRANS
jgi:hypothetical protein